MNKITKTQTYAVCWLHSLNKSSIEIADELKITEKQVLNILEKNTSPKIEQTEDVIKTATSSTAQKVTPKDLMITHTSAKKTNSVSIMTKEASELGDELRKKTPNSNKTDQQRGIFRPTK
jgi:hypothetical protein